MWHRGRLGGRAGQQAGQGPIEARGERNGEGSHPRRPRRYFLRHRCSDLCRVRRYRTTRACGLGFPLPSG